MTCFTPQVQFLLLGLLFLTALDNSRFHTHGCTHAISTHYRGIPTMFTPVTSIPAGMWIFSSPNLRESRGLFPRVCPHYCTCAKLYSVPTNGLLHHIF